MRSLPRNACSRCPRACPITVAGASFNNLGQLLRETGLLPAAEEAFSEAIAARWQLVRDHPGVAEYRQGLALTYDNLGKLLGDMGRVKQAEESYGKGIAAYEGLVKDYPDAPTTARAWRGTTTTSASCSRAQAGSIGRRRPMARRSRSGSAW